MRSPLVVLLVALAVPAGFAHAEPPQAPLLFQIGEGLAAEIGVTLSARLDRFTPVVVDGAGTELDLGVAVHPRVRLRFTLTSERLLDPWRSAFHWEQDVFRTFGSDPTVEGVGLPGGQPSMDLGVRKAFVSIERPSEMRFAVGIMTSHWGLGLLANDGAHEFTAGSARFTDPRYGDRVLRVMGTVGLSREAGIGLTAAFDRVIDDDTTLPGDVAWQGILAATLGQGQDHSGGLYLVYRNQRNDEGRFIRAFVTDVTARSVHASENVTFEVEGEGALVLGRTTMGPSVDFPAHQIAQLGLVGRASARTRLFGAVLDVVYTSGDQNLDDGVQNAFKADPNFDQGFLLFRKVLAAQTGRSPYLASDLNLVGTPALDLERFPTRGSVSNTLSFFPRVWFSPTRGLELYAGPLIALATVPVVDPYNTRIAGGEPRNVFDAPGSGLLGTELDVGVRWEGDLRGVRVKAGVEAGVLILGNALSTTASGNKPIYGGRLMLGLGI